MLQRFIDGPDQNSAQRRDNVNRTHPVLARWQAGTTKNELWLGHLVRDFEMIHCCDV